MGGIGADGDLGIRGDGDPPLSWWVTVCGSDGVGGLGTEVSLSPESLFFSLLPSIAFRLLLFLSLLPFI